MSIVTDWIKFKNKYEGSYRRIGNTMEILSFETYADKTFNTDDLIDIPKGFISLKDLHIVTKVEYNRPTLFLGVAIPGYWNKTTKRLVLIDGWNNILESVGK